MGVEYESDLLRSAYERVSHRTDVAPPSQGHYTEMYQTAPRHHTDVAPRHHADVSPAAHRYHTDNAPTAPRYHSDVSPSAPRHQNNVAPPAHRDQTDVSPAVHAPGPAPSRPHNTEVTVIPGFKTLQQQQVR